MCTTIKRYIGTKKGARTDGDPGGVDHGTVEVDEDAASHLNIGSVVDINRSFYPWEILQ